MKLTFKSSKLTYKTLFGYSLIIITLLVIAVPVFANTTSGNKLLDFSFDSDTGNSPQNARVLTPGVNLNHLDPGQEEWYMYNRDSFGVADLSWISLAMRYESEAVLAAEYVNFEVFADKQPDNGWFQEADKAKEILGVGLRSPLKASQNMVEYFWTGHVAQQELYYVRVFNNSPFSLDYILEAKEEQPAVSGATPASFSSVIGNVEALNARQMAWTLTAHAVDNMSADQATVWMQEAQRVGWLVTAGTTASDIPDPGQADPQLLWNLTAQAIEGQEAEAAARWLVQADSMGWLAIPLNTLKNPNPIESSGSGGAGGDGGGDSEPPAEPIQPKEVYAPVNIYPNNPLELDVNAVNSGRLGPYGEHWYSFVRDDLDKDLFEDMAMTMFFTPRTGYMSDRINFEIIPASQYHIWERGDVDYMEHLGLGMWVSRDEDPDTGERLWSGTLVDGDRYLVKVKNGTTDVVDYYLFPDDVENAELGNPTLHQGDGTAGRVPYAPSPPTRPGPPPVPGAAPPEAIPLKVGATKGTLAAGEERWYRFYFFDPKGPATEHDFVIYLTNTPTDDIRARHADFALYSGDQLHIWTRGTVDELEPFGVSSPSPEKTKNPKSLQVLWDGQMLSDHLYYLKVWNHDIGPLEFELELKGGP
jgi:hypothetical protein